MIDNGLGFQLVPWSPSLEKQLGRHVAGEMKDGGGIDWRLEQRGPSASEVFMTSNAGTPGRPFDNTSLPVHDPKVTLRIGRRQRFSVSQETVRLYADSSQDILKRADVA